ncbi:MAG: hybrid sensor histidine kinase/response regulator [Gammaproteobacteria bacterium]|nr:hybrid sensor histidine kinase/response regulator [Gammaproteobacteria bacterium]
MAAIMNEQPNITVNGRAAKVMVVDDDSTLRSLIRVRLKKSGFEVIEAGDGKAAVNCFLRVSPDIVLMDANMPGMDGFEATRQLKSLPEGKQIPILMVSGLEDDESVDKAFGAGATEYITKPICWPLLVHRLENICSALQAEANLLQAKHAADEANRAKTEFLANMSHELRTPMHAILSFASMGAEKVGKATEEKLARYFSRIEESGKRLLVMLNDLLDLSKLEAGKMIFLVEHNDLLLTADQVIGEFHALARKSEITVRAEPAHVATKAWFDADRILQVVTNLISNALKFSPPKSVVRIIFSDDHLILENGEQIAALRLTVRDEGIGIPEDELESVFEKFVQSSETNTGAGGTGLGLAICKQIVEQHKGKIFAENNQETGTSFHLILPRVNVVD